MRLKASRSSFPNTASAGPRIFPPEVVAVLISSDLICRLGRGALFAVAADKIEVNSEIKSK